MRPPLDGTVLLTGASSGIGLELARQLAGTPKHLILVARRRDRLDALAEELRVRAPSTQITVHTCDLGEPTQVAALAEAVGEVDVLINNAGLGSTRLFEEAAWGELDRLLALNVVGLTLLTHRLLPGMIARRRGGVLNVSSGFGLTWMPGLATYIGSKHFVTGFTEALRAEVAGTGVVISQCCPGPVATEFEAHAGATPATLKGGQALIEIDAATCARHTLAGFRRGRAIIQPGWLYSLTMWAGRISPRWFTRLYTSLVARRLRAERSRA